MSSATPPKSLRIRISPRFTAEKLEAARIEDRIDVYEDRVKGWSFEPIKALLRDPNSVFAATSLTLGYFEGWAQYRFGEDSHGQSKAFFVRAMQEVFPFSTRHVPEHVVEMEEMFDELYQQARCGAFHDGITRKRIVLSRTGMPIRVSAHRETGELSAFIIDPVAFFEDVEAHFERYIAAVRDPANAELRANFTKAWELKHSGGPLHVPPDLSTPM